MHIEKLVVKGFGKLADLNLMLDRGLNIIYGNNESGKTSLQWFIKGMLFGLKGGRISKDGVLPPLRRYKPWSGGDFGGVIEYRLDNGELFRIERNFNTGSVKVFDACFNDITISFEQSRERGAHFAEKHLGVSEVCFDKTVFIRQMESKIGEDGTGELINRLINVGQTGFEDVSFAKAEEALKEALKKYVGTDKTTTRPLDRINARLEELRALKLEISNRRESLFGTEVELKSLKEKKFKLEQRREWLVKLKETADISETVLKNKKLKEEIDAVLKSIDADEEALESYEKKLLEAERKMEQLKKFSSVNPDDTDRIDMEYSRFISLQENIRKTEGELDRKRSDLNDVESQLGNLKAFNYMDENVEEQALSLVKDKEKLKRNLTSESQGSINEKVRCIRRKEHRYIYITAVSAALSVILALAGLMGFFAGYAMAVPAIALTAVFSIKKRSATKQINKLLNEKTTVDMGSVVDEINKKKESLEKLYKAVGASCIEEFLIMKEKYNNLVRQIDELSRDIGNLENERDISIREAAGLKESIAGMLHKTGIIDNTAAEVNPEMIRVFKSGVRSYRETESAISYMKQRIEDIETSIRRCYKNASSISGIPCGSREDIERILHRISGEIETLEQQLKKEETSSQTTGLAGSLQKEWVIGDDLDEIDEEIKRTLLRITECETLLRGWIDDDELQRVTEEIDMLMEKKSELEDVGISLKTALEVLNEASGELQRDFMPHLNLAMSGIISKISCGKYKDLRADDNLMLKVIAPETGDVAMVPSLSGGTVDQMYLALRIAMADLIGSTGEKLPLIMDEVLAQYDDERMRETLLYLYGLSGTRQIILFTCKGREVDIAREICGGKINVVRLL